MLTLLEMHGHYRAVFDIGSARVVHTIGSRDLKVTEKHLRFLADQATKLADHCRGRIDRKKTSGPNCPISHRSTVTIAQHH
ncbi:hypothetical protein [Phyllobacterium sp. UNC302MFCol5.2]|uniref:hypothetical protein n=1 Tax=Phyllobacterium sp. UNC302MFCol5.2 TaxID=1449065 RepID=UPI0012DE85D2|nr:hypothetical protein [Phyllobacterium sp. UNC302MFCol5.2]